MNGKIVSIHLTVIVSKAPYVVIDAPNIYHDNICIKHRRRLCPDCMKDQETCEKHGTHRCKECRREMIKNGLVKRTKGGGVVANTRYGNNWERTLDIKRLPEVELKISSKGYKPLFYVEFSTIDYMYENKEKYEGMNQKLEILEGLDSRGRLVKFEKHKPPGVKKSDDPNYDDDLWIIQSAIVLEEDERVDCYIMSNDHFSIYSKEGSKRFIQFDWTWEKIHERRIAYDWIPPDSDEDDNQKFTSPKWENIPKFELSIEEEYKLINAEIRDTEIKLEKLKEKKSNLSPIIKAQDDIPKILKTEEREHRKIDQFKKEVTTAVWWACENKMDENGFLPAAEIWGSIKTKIKSISSILNLVGSELGQTAEYDEDEFLKVELGYNKNTDIIKIVEDAVLIYQKEEGVELKFTPDQEQLRVKK